MPAGSQAARLRALAAGRPSSRPALPPSWNARTCVVASGKGGVGKSNVALNLALALAATGRRTLLIDADVGMGNVEVLCGVRLALHLGHFLRGECDAVDLVEAGPGGIWLMAGGHALLDEGEFDRAAVARLLAGLAVLPGPVQDVLVDLPAGLGKGVRSWLAAADRVLLVMLPEPTSLADAYAVCKFLAQTNPAAEVAVVVNRAAGAREAHEAFARLATTCGRFLGTRPQLLGAVPEDAAVGRAVVAQEPLLLAAPLSPAATAIRTLAARLDAVAPDPAAGEGAPSPGGLAVLLARLLAAARRRTAREGGGAG